MQPAVEVKTCADGTPLQRREDLPVGIFDPTCACGVKLVPCNLGRGGREDGRKVRKERRKGTAGKERGRKEGR